MENFCDIRAIRRHASEIILSTKTDELPDDSLQWVQFVYTVDRARDQCSNAEGGLVAEEKENEERRQTFSSQLLVLFQQRYQQSRSSNRHQETEEGENIKFIEDLSKTQSTEFTCPQRRNEFWQTATLTQFHQKVANWPNEELQGQAVHAKNWRIFSSSRWTWSHEFCFLWWEFRTQVVVTTVCATGRGVHTLCCRTHILSAHIRTSSCVHIHAWLKAEMVCCMRASLVAISPSPFPCFALHPCCSRTDTSTPCSRPHFLPMPDRKARVKRTSARAPRSLATWPSSVSTRLMSPKSSTRSLLWTETRCPSTIRTTIASMTSRKPTRENTEQIGVPTLFETSVLHVSHRAFALQREIQESMLGKPLLDRERERKEKGKVDGTVLGVILFRLTENSSDERDLREDLERRAQQAVLGENSARRKFTLDWLRLGDPELRAKKFRVRIGWVPTRAWISKTTIIGSQSRGRASSAWENTLV